MQCTRPQTSRFVLKPDQICSPACLFSRLTLYLLESPRKAAPAFLHIKACNVCYGSSQFCVLASQLPRRYLPCGPAALTLLLGSSCHALEPQSPSLCFLCHFPPAAWNHHSPLWILDRPLALHWLSVQVKMGQMNQMGGVWRGGGKPSLAFF